jgi:ribosomal protein L39E
MRPLEKYATKRLLLEKLAAGSGMGRATRLMLSRRFLPKALALPQGERDKLFTAPLQRLFERTDRMAYMPRGRVDPGTYHSIAEHNRKALADLEPRMPKKEMAIYRALHRNPRVPGWASSHTEPPTPSSYERRLWRKQPPSGKAIKPLEQPVSVPGKLSGLRRAVGDSPLRRGEAQKKVGPEQVAAAFGLRTKGIGSSLKLYTGSDRLGSWNDLAFAAELRGLARGGQAPVYTRLPKGHSARKVYRETHVAKKGRK